MEWQRYQNSLCSGCGLPRHETFQTGREAEERYEAEVLRCNACRARDAKVRNFRDASEHTDMGGIYAVIREADD